MYVFDEQNFNSNVALNVQPIRWESWDEVISNSAFPYHPLLVSVFVVWVRVRYFNISRRMDLMIDTICWRMGLILIDYQWTFLEVVYICGFVVHMILWSVASCNESRNECMRDEGGKENASTRILENYPLDNPIKLCFKYESNLIEFNLNWASEIDLRDNLSFYINFVICLTLHITWQHSCSLVQHYGEKYNLNKQIIVIII